MGVLFFLVNCIFAVVILVMVLWMSVRAVTSKNPDTRYQPMRDDRGSFIKSQASFGTTQELDALGATARGDHYAEQKRLDIEEDSLASSLAVNQISHNPPMSEKYQNDGGYQGRSESPLDSYSGPMSSRSAQQHRAQNSTSPNPWQRGVGYH
jgi:hypothetical protein